MSESHRCSWIPHRATVHYNEPGHEYEKKLLYLIFQHNTSAKATLHVSTRGRDQSHVPSFTHTPAKVVEVVSGANQRGSKQDVGAYLGRPEGRSLSTISLSKDGRLEEKGNGCEPWSACGYSTYRTPPRHLPNRRPIGRSEKRETFISLRFQHG